MFSGVDESLAPGRSPVTHSEAEPVYESKCQTEFTKPYAHTIRSGDRSIIPPSMKQRRIIEMYQTTAHATLSHHTYLERYSTAIGICLHGDAVHESDVHLHGDAVHEIDVHLHGDD